MCLFFLFFSQGYLGSVEAGEGHAAPLLVTKYKGPATPILIDQV